MSTTEHVVAQRGRQLRGANHRHSLPEGLADVLWTLDVSAYTCVCNVGHASCLNATRDTSCVMGQHESYVHPGMEPGIVSVLFREEYFNGFPSACDMLWLSVSSTFTCTIIVPTQRVLKAPVKSCKAGVKTGVDVQGWRGGAGIDCNSASPFDKYIATKTMTDRHHSFANYGSEPGIFSALFCFESYSEAATYSAAGTAA